MIASQYLLRLKPSKILHNSIKKAVEKIFFDRFFDKYLAHNPNPKNSG